MLGQVVLYARSTPETRRNAAHRLFSQPLFLIALLTIPSRTFDRTNTSSAMLPAILTFERETTCSKLCDNVSSVGLFSRVALGTKKTIVFAHSQALCFPMLRRCALVATARSMTTSRNPKEVRFFKLLAVPNEFVGSDSLVPSRQ